MGIYADPTSFERRVALRGLAIVAAVIALAFATAWLTLGRAGRFQELKGVFFSLDLPPTFERIDQEGSGASLTSLADSPSIERTFASKLKVNDACASLSRAFRNSETEMFPAPRPARDAECSYSGSEGRFSVRAEARSVRAFLRRVEVGNLDVPDIPIESRAILTVVVSD